jgi:hypothetical protein
MAVTIKQATVWHDVSFEQAIAEFTASPIISISVESDDNPRIGCEIAARLAEAEIPVAFATMHRRRRRYRGILGFFSQADADRAIELINGEKLTTKVA